MNGRQLPSAPKYRPRIVARRGIGKPAYRARCCRRSQVSADSFVRPDRSDDGVIYRVLEGLHQAAPQPRYPGVPTVAAHAGMAWGSARRIPACL